MQRLLTRIESHKPVWTTSNSLIFEVIHIEGILINKAIYFNLENTTVYVIIIKKPRILIFRLAM
jgi:hypothetical protein